MKSLAGGYDEISSAWIKTGKYIVCAKADDPIVRQARARLIWAANTAQAAHNLKIKTVLVGGSHELPFKTSTLAGIGATERHLSNIYGISGGFDIKLLYGGKKDKDFCNRIINNEYANHVLPYAGLVHTRDPMIAAACAKRKINYILEHHAEDYQSNKEAHNELQLNSPCCRAIVAITETVKKGLIDIGYPKDKILVLESGVNSTSFEDRSHEARRWRKFLLQGIFKNIVCYTGGMQKERGIEHILESSKEMPSTCFVFVGGHSKDIALWEDVIAKNGLFNVKMIGYQPHSTVCEIQQASDILIVSRKNDDRASITSPLKFFEYLACGAPILAASIASLSKETFEGADITWYDPADPNALTEGLNTIFARKIKWPNRNSTNIALAERYTWEQRQVKLMKFVGPVTSRTTF